MKKRVQNRELYGSEGGPLHRSLLSEDDYLLQEILFNPRTPSQVENIRLELKQLLEIITNKDAEGMKKYLTKIREKIK